MSRRRTSYDDTDDGTVITFHVPFLFGDEKLYSIELHSVEREDQMVMEVLQSDCRDLRWVPFGVVFVGNERLIK